MEVRDTQIINTSIDGNLTKNGDSTPIFSKVIRQELSEDSSAYIYSRCRVNFTNNDVGTEAPDFMYLGLLTINASDELRSFGYYIPDLEGQRMDPTSLRLFIFLEKLKRLE